MGLIDTHTHLESFFRSGALADALSRAQAAGVERLITIGTSSDDWELYRTLAEERRGFVDYTVGLHPCSVAENWESEIAQVERFWQPASANDGDAARVRPVGLGEIGLDRFHLPKEPEAAAPVFAAQQQAFRAGLEIARRLACPIVIHSRGAFAECVQMIDASGVDWRRVVFHCFTEGPEEMRQLRERGGVGSFTGILTYKTAQNIRDAAKAQGLDHFMLETDAPYLTPVPHRGKPNEPALIRHTAEFAATLFGITSEELARISSDNARRFFGVGG